MGIVSFVLVLFVAWRHQTFFHDINRRLNVLEKEMGNECKK